ncbi:MAG: C45 family autoproteolytic acyltransferase/hydrolase [Acidimicrobiales bacterium]
MKRPPIRVLDLAGSAEEMGHAHGVAHAGEIRAYTDERVRLVMAGTWSGGPVDRATVLDLAEARLPAHERFSPVLHAEMLAMASGVGITPAEAVVVGGFTDFVDTVRANLGGQHPDTVMEDDCTAFIVPDAKADGAGFFGQTWDMHDSATDYVVLLRTRPADHPAALVFTTTGCLGQIGMNELGVCVGINNSPPPTARSASRGPRWCARRCIRNRRPRPAM